MTTGPLAIVRHVVDHDVTYDALMIWCPAPKEYGHHGECGLHMLQISGDRAGGIWGFDGNLDAPTIGGSVLTHGGDGFVCHAFVRAGQWEYLTDCTHPLAGQTVPMVPLPAWVTE
ncbi:MAG: hypothetical protein Q8M17_10490 [Actinomycetota bacterium]|nr:hypothetical protein [Actinomycetota bacterium]